MGSNWMKSALAMVAVALIGTSALAQSAADAVKQRQDIMKGLFGNYRTASQIARGESTDVASVPASAEKAIADIRKFATLFPAGSGREAVPDTRAKPEVWSMRSEFEAKNTALIEETQKLANAAKTGDIEAVKAQYANVSRSCGGCHGGPRPSGGTFRFEAQ